MSDVEELLVEQARYYRDRAGEYDEWWLRRGRYDNGAEANGRWFAEVAEVQAALEQFEPAGDVLELACGTGLWTIRLARHAERLTALDAAGEVLELARARVSEAHVTYLQADLFAWQPDRMYDVCFFGFWLSHVPEERFGAFWEKVRRAVGAGGRVFFVDSLRSTRSAAAGEAPGGEDRSEHASVARRQLADGREYQIVKRFYDPSALQRRLGELGFTAHVAATSEFFLYGHAEPAA